MKYDICTIIPINTEKYSRDAVKIIQNTFGNSKRVVVMMGLDAEHHKANISSGTSTIVTIGEEYNFARAINGTIKVLENQLEPGTFLCISDPNYIWNYSKDIDSISKQKMNFNKDFLYINILHDFTKYKDLNIFDSGIVSNVALRVDRLSKVKNKKIIDQVYIARADKMISAIKNLSKELNNFKIKDIRTELISSKLYPIESLRCGYNIDRLFQYIDIAKTEVSPIEDDIVEKRDTIETIVNNDKLTMLIPFPIEDNTSPRDVGCEDSWRQLLPLLDKTGVFNIIIGGKFPFNKESYKKNCNNIWFSEDDKWIEDPEQRFLWIVKNSKFVFGIKNKQSKTAIERGLPSFLIGRNFKDFNIPEKVKVKLIETPNPKFDGVSIFRDIRKFLNI